MQEELVTSLQLYKKKKSRANVSVPFPTSGWRIYIEVEDGGGVGLWGKRQEMERIPDHVVRGVDRR